MKNATISIFTVLALLFAFSPSIAAEKPSESPKVYALIFHADWCGSCKAMGPDVMKLMNDSDIQGADFVKYNKTTDETIASSKELLKEKGLSDFADRKGTGYVLLINADTKEVVGKLQKNMSYDEMKKEVQSHLG